MADVQNMSMFKITTVEFEGAEPPQEYAGGDAVPPAEGLGGGAAPPRILNLFDFLNVCLLYVEYSL